MTNSNVGTAEPAVPTVGNADEHRLESAERALELCDRALELMGELQRTSTHEPKSDLQEAIAAVQAVRTELITMTR